jgi:hypothetical protein
MTESYRLYQTKFPIRNPVNSLLIQEFYQYMVGLTVNFEVRVQLSIIEPYYMLGPNLAESKAKLVLKIHVTYTDQIIQRVSL